MLPRAALRLPGATSMSSLCDFSEARRARMHVGTGGIQATLRAGQFAPNSTRAYDFATTHAAATQFLGHSDRRFESQIPPGRVGAIATRQRGGLIEKQPKVETRNVRDEPTRSSAMPSPSLMDLTMTIFALLTSTIRRNGNRWNGSKTPRNQPCDYTNFANPKVRTGKTWLLRTADDRNDRGATCLWSSDPSS
jgi:hypothetical protein